MRRPERECCCGVNFSLPEVSSPALSSSSSSSARDRFRLPPRADPPRVEARGPLLPLLPRGRPPRPRARVGVVWERASGSGAAARAGGRTVIESLGLEFTRALAPRPRPRPLRLNVPLRGPEDVFVDGTISSFIRSGNAISAGSCIPSKEFVALIVSSGVADGFSCSCGVWFGVPFSMAYLPTVIARSVASAFGTDIVRNALSGIDNVPLVEDIVVLSPSPSFPYIGFNSMHC